MIIRVRDVMSERVVVAGITQTVIEVARLMADTAVGAVVIQSDTRCVGIFSERDLTHYYAAAHGGGGDVAVDALMTVKPMVVGPDERIEVAASMMADGGFRHLPVIDGEQIVGIVSIRDVLLAVMVQSRGRERSEALREAS